MSFFDTQNPGIGGLDELTDSEALLVQSLNALGDPNADRILFWDDSNGGYRFLIVGSGLTITDDTITAAGGGTIDGSGSANEIPYWVDSDTLGTLAVATYPNLTELSRVKGLTSAVQTQLDARIPTSYLDTDTSLTANSDVKVATQRAVKAYVDASVTGLLDLKGSTDCSTNPNYPAASKGDSYYVTVAGKIGGASGKVVEVGDVYVALNDNAGGDEATVGTSWFVLNQNLSGVALTSGTLGQFATSTIVAIGVGTIELGHASDTTISRVSAGVIAVEGKTIANFTDGGTFVADISVPDEAYGAGWNGSTEVPTKNAIYDKIETIGGASTLTYTGQTTTYSILTSDQIVNCTSGTFTVTLPTAVGVTGKFYYIKNTGTGVITIATTSSQTIDGDTTFLLTQQYSLVKIASDGANWIII